MTRHQGTALALVVVAALVNCYGAVRKGNSIAVPVFAGFVIGTALMAAAGPAPVVGESLALAYLVTSATVNGNDLVALITGVSDAAPAPAADTASASGKPASPSAPRAV